MAITIIVKKSRADIVRKQKAVIDYVDKGIRSGKDHMDSKLQEACHDFQRWNKESKLFSEPTVGRTYLGTDTFEPEKPKKEDNGKS